MPCKQYKQKLTLHELISTYTRKIGADLIFTSKRKLSGFKRGCFKSLKRIGHCTSVFAFGFFGDVKQTVHQTFTRYWHHKKDMMGYDTNCD
jgi:hypothetical protein